MENQKYQNQKYNHGGLLKVCNIFKVESFTADPKKAFHSIINEKDVFVLISQLAQENQFFIKHYRSYSM
jgi:hypothetical protein